MRLIVFLACSGIGYVLGHYLPEPWASYVSILVSYHLFLAWLVITAEHEGGLSLPVLPTVLTHAACLALLIGLAMGRRQAPILGLASIFVPGLAPFESNWLFGGGRPKKNADPKAAGDLQGSRNDAIAQDRISSDGVREATSDELGEAEAEYTANDHTAWLRYLAHPRRAFRKPGLTVAQEFKLWQAARVRYKAMLSQSQRPE